MPTQASWNVHFVNREPDGGKGYEPEKEETHEVLGSDAGGFRKVIRCRQSD